MMANADSAPTLPPFMALYQMITGYYVSRALHAVAKLGVADHLRDGPRDCAALAAATRAHAPALRRVLRLLASVGVFREEEDGTFALTALGELLRADVPGSMRAAMIVFGGRTQNEWSNLMYCVETGEPAYRQRGETDPFAAMQRDPEAVATFDAAMADFTRMTSLAVAAAYDFSAMQTVVDVGGGNGALLIGVLNANPSLRGVVFDRVDVVPRTKTNLERAGLAARCSTVGGSFFESVPGGGDAYMLKHVIHDWNDERAAAILTTCRRAMTPQARLLIIEGVYPPRIEPSLAARGAAANDVNMLVCTGGRQRSEAEFRELFAASGFALGRIVPTMAGASVIEGHPRTSGM
jgi:hypothetical protein